ncbi:glutamate transport system substrate-binding protein [Microbacterium sp. W4I4]|uniref:glutamate ABC transporter substrate-binding protein n=1 Tax=Microbacterium sp. W4I4 TaxID=3042295 RepID=UPI0027864A73|nr:glutamate ABC transporter substrate-binding protein [Microbacterium sp. W4I4]MDQ0615750.1 glutamate transport system substrate-binding protein [Microbacterium sp. W4I4]
MSQKKISLSVVGLAALGLVLSACSTAVPGAESDTKPADAVEFPVSSSVELEGSPTFEAMQERGKIILGVKEDQPGFGMRDAATGERSGFDIDLARWIAAELGFGEDRIEYVTIPSQSREQSLTNGDADLIIGMYTISEKRKELVGFAGPYMTNGQSLLVRADNTDIKGEDDMAGHKVCSITGSTPIQYVKQNHPDVETVEFDNMAQCVDALTSSQVDAVTTDEALLIGYTTLAPDQLKVVGKPFTHEGFGIGVSKTDDALRKFVNGLLTEDSDVLQKIYDGNLGSSGVAFQAAEVDNY